MAPVLKDLIPYIWSILFGNRDRSATPAAGITIAVVGRSGSGISKLIHDATGSYVAGVAPDSWHDTGRNGSYTSHIQDRGYTVPGINYIDFPLIFIDTPGFGVDGTLHEALRKLHEWLKRLKPHTELDGLIFMHDVSRAQPRELSAPRDDILAKLCGKEWVKKIVFATTHWDRVANISEMEAQVTDYWGFMHGRGASKWKRYDYPGTGGLAWNILRPLVKQALTERKKRLEQELHSLADLIPQPVHEKIGHIIKQKMDFLRSLTLKLGQNDEILSESQCKAYKRLNEAASVAWKEIENELNIVELERLLTTGLTNDEDRVDKVTIAIMGSIRSGKSQFIYDATGQCQKHVGGEGDIHPHTKGYSIAIHRVPAYEVCSRFDCLVTLIDTPGFDYMNPEKAEKEGLVDLLEWMKKTYRTRAKLDGIIYLHSIQNDELVKLKTRSSFYVLCREALREQWGDKWYNHIVSVSSFWSDDYVDSRGQTMSTADMEGREKQVRECYWNIGAVKMLRHEKSVESARQILKEALLTFL